MALELLEKSDYDDALIMFKKALADSRDIQSLNNLAWIYFHEGEKVEDDYYEVRVDLAIDLLKECINLQTKSHFPYQLLGEAYLRSECWQEALDSLKMAISIQPTLVGFNNMGVAYYHLKLIEQASECYSHASQEYDYAKYSYAKCLIDLGDLIKARVRGSSSS